MKEKLLPSAVLTIVCAVVCGLLAAANAATHDKIVQAEADKVQKSLVRCFGEGTYTPLETAFEGVTAVYESTDGLQIYDITADGYSKGGIRALIGIAQDGSIAGIGIVSCGETAGVGTKITDPAASAPRSQTRHTSHNLTVPEPQRTSRMRSPVRPSPRKGSRAPCHLPCNAQKGGMTHDRQKRLFTRVYQRTPA